MGTITTSSTLFKPELVKEVFSKVKGHSSLAKLGASVPMTFAGTDNFVFTMDGEASIVGEGANKPAGNAEFKSVTVKPIKFIYQHRVTDEFVKLSAEKQVPILSAFADGFAKKIARALDIAALHGVNPYDGAASATVGNNCFVNAVENAIEFVPELPDENIDMAVKPIQAADGIITGIAMSPAFGSALGSMKNAATHTPLYPEYRFGGNPGTFGGMAADINTTVSFGESTLRAVVGDFANVFKWGYAENVPIKIIEYGDPDGQGDLQRMNQIVLRSEAYIGWGILDPASFALITKRTLALTLAAGNSGKTKVAAVTPSASGTNTYKYQIGDEAVPVSYNETCGAAWTDLTVNSTQITASANKTITVVEVDANGKIKASGTIKVKSADIG